MAVMLFKLIFWFVPHTFHYIVYILFLIFPNFRHYSDENLEINKSYSFWTQVFDWFLVTDHYDNTSCQHYSFSTFNCMHFYLPILLLGKCWLCVLTHLFQIILLFSTRLCTTWWFYVRLRDGIFDPIFCGV